MEVSMKNNFKKIFAAILVFVFVVMAMPVTEAQAANASTRKYWDQYSTDYYYNQLSTDEKKLYNRLDDVCYKALVGKSNYNSGKTDSANCSDLDINKNSVEKVARAFSADNPQYYFTYFNYGYSFYNSGKITSVYMNILDSYTKGSTRKATTKTIKKQLNKLYNKAKNGKTKYDKIKKVHDLLSERITYQFSAEHGLDQTIADPIIYNEGVCNAYAMLNLALLNRLGIDTVYVAGNDHAWNKVKLDDKWYIIDATWDDQTWGTIYTYFLISDKTAKANDTQNCYIEMMEGGLKAPKADKDYSKKEDSKTDKKKDDNTSWDTNTNWNDDIDWEYSDYGDYGDDTLPDWWYDFFFGDYSLEDLINLGYY